ncbi:MAG TPA: hypothetical protein VM204_03240 [Gaiellaceae bacterium]|nr:hypothetical protein [Gaiellaceae bacterium]
MAALAGLGLVAHGGLGGLIVEGLLVVTVAVVFAGVWLRERRSRSADAGGDDADASPDER